MRDYGQKPYMSKNYREMTTRTTDYQMYEKMIEKASEMKKPYQNSDYPEMEHFYPPKFPPPWVPPWLPPKPSPPGGSQSDCNTLWQSVMKKYAAGGYNEEKNVWNAKSWDNALHDYSSTSTGVDASGKAIVCPLYYHCFPGKVYSPTTNCRSRAGSWYPCMQYEWMQSCGYTLTWACAKDRSEIYGSPVCGYNCSFPCLGTDCDHLNDYWYINKYTICEDYINGKGAGA